jgi:hypothetical protein
VQWLGRNVAKAAWQVAKISLIVAVILGLAFVPATQAAQMRCEGEQ